MSQITDRYLRARLRMETDSTDWLNLDRITSAVGNEKLNGEESVQKNDKFQSLMNFSGERRGWLNYTNVTEFLVVRELLSKNSKFMRSTVDPTSIERAAKLGISVLQGRNELTSTHDVSAISLAIPFLPNRDTDYVRRTPSAVELVCDANPLIKLHEFFRSVVLPRQVVMARKRFIETLIFTVTDDEDIVGLLLSHGWSFMEPEFELILKREMRGSTYKRTEKWLSAP